MKRKMLIIFLLFYSALYSQESQFCFNLNGKIENIENVKGQELELSYIDNGTIIQKTIDMRNGKFSIKGNISEPTFAQLKLGEVSVHFWLEEGNISLSFSVVEPDKLEIKGSELWQQTNMIKNEVSKSLVIQDSIISVRDLIAKELEIEKDSIRTKKLKLEQKKVTQVLDSIIKKNQLYSIYRFRSDPNSFITIKALIQLFPMFYGRWISSEEAIEIYNELSFEKQNTPTGKKVKQLIENYRNTEIGHQAPDFETKDIHGNTVKLSDFRCKKAVLLDAWASWCGPCIKNIPHINEIYHQYKDNGLVIIGISMDSDIKQWQEAIIKYKTEDWIHILADRENLSWFTKGFSEEDILFKYPLIESIPRYFLINKKGIVVGNWKKYSNEILIELQKILEN
ncbi:redoxin domain-containing protein [Dysgonomonas reticulitermitis]